MCWSLSRSTFAASLEGGGALDAPACTGGGVISTISSDSGDSGAGVSTFLRWRNDVRVRRGGAARVACSSSVDS